MSWIDPKGSLLGLGIENQFHVRTGSKNQVFNKNCQLLSIQQWRPMLTCLCMFIFYHLFPLPLYKGFKLFKGNQTVSKFNILSYHPSHILLHSISYRTNGFLLKYVLKWNWETIRTRFGKQNQIRNRNAKKRYLTLVFTKPYMSQQWEWKCVSSTTPPPMKKYNNIT